MRKNLSLPIPGDPPSKIVGTHCTEQAIATGQYAIAIYTDTSADYSKVASLLLSQVIGSIERQLKCTVTSEIHPQATVITHIKKQKVRRITPWVLEIKTTDKWGGDWLHAYQGETIQTERIAESIRGPTSTLTETMNIVSLPHPTQHDPSGSRKMVKHAFTLALPAIGKKEINQGQEHGGLAREEKKTIPHAIYITGIHLNCSPEKFLREITQRVVEMAKADFSMIPELTRPPPPQM